MFSALGFYQVTPGVNQYAFGSMLFKKETLKLKKGKKFEIDAENNSRDNLYL